MSEHTVQDDFQHFLSYSGLRKEPPDVIEKMYSAFFVAWERKPSGSDIPAGDQGPKPTPENYGDTWLDVYHAMLEDIEGETISQKINRLREMAGLEKWS